MKSDIAIIGVGFRLPSGEEGLTNDSPDKFWADLKRGFNGVIPTTERWSDNFSKLGEISNGYAGLLPFEEVKAFDPLFFGISPSEAPSVDPQQRILLKATWECLEDAGIDHSSLRGTTTSVFIGSSTTEYRESNLNMNEQYANIFGTYAHGIANRISYCFDLHGESLTIDTACSSSCVAISLASQSIQTGKSKISIAGGVNLILDTTNIKAFSYLNMLSTSGECRPFDAKSDGIIRGEGVGIIALKRLSEAIKDGNKIYAVINGSNHNVDGNGLTDKQNFYSPSSTSQSENIKMALKSTNGAITADDIDYFECHGTGTPTGDPIETKGISLVFNRSKDNPLLIGSLKGSTGHTEAASGVLGVIKCCLILKNQCLVPSFNYLNPNPLIKFDEWNLKVVTRPIEFSKIQNYNYKDKPFTIAINNFGITGSNCCIILSEYKKQQQQQPNKQELNKSYLIPISANSVKSLQLYKQLLNFKIEKSLTTNEFNNQKLFKSIIVNQIYNKSNLLYQRMITIASDLDSFLNSNENNTIKTTSSKSSNISIGKKKPIIIFVCSGQGSQYHKMLDQLYNDEPMFRKSIDKIDKSLFKYYGYSVLDRLRSSSLNSIQEPNIAQPAVCMLICSLFELYKYWGIEPSYIIGHSLGEIPAAFCSGLIDLETLSYVIYHRSIAQTKTHGNGRMISINQSAEDYISKYSSKYPTLEIACYNSPNSIVIAGNEDEINKFSTELKENDEFSAIIPSRSSFHTSSQQVIKGDILNMQFPSSSLSTYPIFSTVTTNLFEGSFNSQYIYDNIISSVNFSQTIENMYKHIESNNSHSDNEIIFIELAPHPTLSFHLKQMKPSLYVESDFKLSVYSPLHKSKNSTIEFNKVISQLYCDNGVDINFKCQFALGETNVYDQEFPLPNYQWDDQPYWKVDYNHYKSYSVGPPISILGNQNLNSPFEHSYETFIDIKRKPFQYLKGHQIKGKYYFPGTGYIDNLLKIYPSQDLSIDNLEFIAPLIFVEGNNLCLQTNVYQSGRGKNQYALDFHFKDRKTNEWVKTCTGNFHLSNNLTTDQSFDIQDLLKYKCNLTVISSNDLYNLIKIKTGIQYSGSFKGINKCYMGNGCSLSEVSLNLPLNLADQESFFNASILDSCTHGLLSLVLDYQSQLVFQKVKEFRYYSLNIPTDRSKHSKIYVYTVLNDYDIANDSFSASIVIMLENGKILIEIENIVSKSVSPIQDTLKIEYPTNELFSTCLQPKDSQIKPPIYFKSILGNQQEEKDASTILSICQQYISLQFLNNIEKRSDITFNQIKSMDMNQLLQSYCFDKKNERLFKFVFETIKQFGNYMKLSENQIEIIKKDGILEILGKSTKIIPKLLFPFDIQEDDPITENPASLFENGLLDEYYNRNTFMTSKIQRNLIADIVMESIKPLLQEKIVFRILELGGGVCSLSTILVDKINKLLNENPLFEIDIEITWSDISTSFIPQAKEKLSHLNKGVNIVYRVIDAEKEFIKQQHLKPSYFDMILMSNVIHVVKNIGKTLDQLYEILTPNGQLLLNESFVSVVNDSIFGVFSQWWAFDDERVDRCCMNPKGWLDIISKHKFKNSISFENEGSCCYVIQTQKPSLNDIMVESSSIVLSSPLKQIIYGNMDDSKNSKQFNNLLSNNGTIKISNIDQFKDLLKNEEITDETTIYFTKPIIQLTIDNFKPITLEYIQINQLLLSNNLKSRHVLITLDSTHHNYLAASVVGAKRYFEEHNQLDLNSIDIDSNSLESIDNLRGLLSELFDQNKHTQRDFIIRNGGVYYERVKKESGLKKKFKSNSFEENNSLMATLSTNLNYHLQSKQTTLNDNEVEVQVCATTIENLSKESIKKEFICGFSGIVKRIPNKLLKPFKVGDKVYGFGYNTISSHVVVMSEWIHKIPSTISNIEAASVSFKYLESFYALYTIGDLSKNDSVLVHSGNLSILNILKWKGHKAPIFVTVDSDEKERYIKEVYGNFVYAIYQIKNTSYITHIKSTCKNGVDLIINSSTIDNMDSNVKCLKKNSGRIIDLGQQNYISTYTTNQNFIKLNASYYNLDLLSAPKPLIKSLFKEITKSFENHETMILPTTDFSNSNIYEAMSQSGNGIHTCVVENDVDLLDKLVKNHSIEPNYSILKSNYHIPKEHLGKNILVTGQTGTVLEILKWIVKYSKNIENIIILSKSSIKWELQLLIGKTKESLVNNQIKFHFKSVDISDSNQLYTSLNQIVNENNIDNIDSIFHYAFTQITNDVLNIDLNQLNVSHGAKTIGAINLHNESIKRNWKLKNFVNASSTVSLAGSPNQCSYVSASCVIDSFSRYRQSLGLPSICSYYGSIKSGTILRNESIAVALEGQGYSLIEMNKVLGSLDLQIQNQHISTNLIVSGFNFNLLKNNPQQSIADKFEHQINEAAIKSSSAVIASGDSDTNNLKKSIGELLISKVSELLSVEESNFNSEISLVDYGSDSLITGQLKNWFEKEFGPNLITVQQLSTNSINSLITLIQKNLNKNK